LAFARSSDTSASKQPELFVRIPDETNTITISHKKATYLGTGSVIHACDFLYRPDYVRTSNKIAGIDVHKKVLTVVVIDATTPEEKPARRRYTTPATSSVGIQKVPSPGRSTIPSEKPPLSQVAPGKRLVTASEPQRNSGCDEAEGRCGIGERSEGQLGDGRPRSEMRA
jgi:hypothetical protein